ncbi:MAG: hypothetical protein IJA00_07625 [Bacteroidaceae bacterium]|nr:hypothetical protein [Bacteroidaceae bacterium]
MKIGTFINHGTIIEIESVQTMNLSVDKGQVCIGEQSLQEFVSSHAPGGVQEGDTLEDALSEAEPPQEDFSEAQRKASGIKVQPGVVLSLMREMQPLFTQKVDWLSPYSVLLRRRWVDGNVSAWCRMVDKLFGVKLDSRTLSTDLNKLGSADYTQWTDADKRILRRKQLATDFDTRLTEYFERKRTEVLCSVRE